MSDFDLIIRRGTIVDGRRTPRYVGDVGIKDGYVEVITGADGLSAKSADKEIDADGLIVAPGFVDLHTHFDAQIYWDPYCTMSGWHGVTSVVIGNCGFGLAPCRPEMRKRAMQTLTRNEAVSYPAMEAGLPWDWETLPEYLDSVEATPKGLNILSYIGLAPIFMHVMGGADEAKRRRPTRDEMDEMKRIISEAMDAGACGISAQFMGENSVQRDYDGTPMVTDVMHFDDLLELASVLKEKGRGAIQITGITQDQGDQLCAASGATLIYNAIAIETDQHGQKMEDWVEWLDWAKRGNEKGYRITPQTMVAGVDFEFTLDEWNLYDVSEHWREMTLGTPEERKRKMADPARRKALREEYDGILSPEERYSSLAGSVTQYLALADHSITYVDREDLKKYEGMTVGQVAAEQNKHPVDAMLDLAVEDDLQTTFATPPQELHPEEIQTILHAPHCIPGVSDGGAHMKFQWLGRFATEYIVNWVRKHGLVDLEYAHWHLSAVPAQAAGLHDRGVVQVGRPADIIVYDYDQLGWGEVEKLYDFPAGDWRRASKGVGYRYTIVNGEITFEGQECTGKTPGRLLRHGANDSRALLQQAS